MTECICYCSVPQLNGEFHDRVHLLLQCSSAEWRVPGQSAFVIAVFLS